MMTLKELKEFIANLPEDFDNFTLVNGEFGFLDKGKGEEPEAVFRVDKPIVSLYVDESSEELCILHQTRDEVKDIVGDNLKDGTTEENKE